MGLTANGGLLEVVASKDGSWTIIVTMPNGYVLRRRFRIELGKHRRSSDKRSGCVTRPPGKLFLVAEQFAYGRQ